MKRESDAAAMLHSAEHQTVCRYGAGTIVDKDGHARNEYGGEPGYRCLFAADDAERWRREIAR